MVEAQEMFKNSNKVTRPEKALILGFMAGSRGKKYFYIFVKTHRRLRTVQSHFSYVFLVSSSISSKLASAKHGLC